MPVIANGNKWQPLMCCFLPMAQIWWQTRSKEHKIDENSSIVLKWQILAKGSTIKEQQKAEQTLYCLKAAKIGKMWDKQTAAKSGINFTLAFSGKY